MGLTSVQVCMDSSDWLQGTINEESGMECSSLTGEMLSCSRPLTERRLRPQQEQALKCPRCDSTHTKFCYYNNYSLSQPRYFCKTCRRYWTKGGTLRNIPVGGGCRKNKKLSSSAAKKSNDHPQSQPISLISSHHAGSSSNNSHNPTDLHLSSFADHQQMHFPHFPNFMEIGGMIDNQTATHRPFDFMDAKMEAVVGTPSHHHHYPTNADQLAMMGALPGAGGGDHIGLCSPPYGLSLDGAAIGPGLMIPYDHQEEPNSNSSMDVKPNAKVLALEWQDQGCSQKLESYGYMNGMGSSWNGMMSNGYGHGPSTTNPLV